VESLELRYKSLSDAFKSLEIIQTQFAADHDNLEYYRVIRDSKIQRFEYTMDTLWKYLREYLEYQGRFVEVASPKKVFLVCFNANLVNQQEMTILIRAMDDRNLTSHLYREVLAEEVSTRIDSYSPFLKAIIERVQI
jgi:nucleotidyltransferase substrate binding protein (TIGR01987 family)